MIVATRSPTPRPILRLVYCLSNMSAIECLPLGYDGSFQGLYLLSPPIVAAKVERLIHFYVADVPPYKAWLPQLPFGN